jgi:hypothetical protein
MSEGITWCLMSEIPRSFGMATTECECSERWNNLTVDFVKIEYLKRFDVIFSKGKRYFINYNRSRR